MKRTIKLIFAVVAATQIGMSHASELIELSEFNFEEYGRNKSVVILQVNWGRSWNCGDYENAQLHKLIFKRSSSDDQSITPISLAFEIPSQLFAKDTFLPYAYIVEPGEYALTEFDVKVARSSSDVGHLIATESQLFRDEQPVGGTFKAVANEAVYIGTFGVDCYKEPMPWRYYIEGRDEFDRFVDGFRHKYSFIKSMPVAYRLFSTSTMGQPYSLD